MIHEYKCRLCNYRFEVYYSKYEEIKDLISCENCNLFAAEKQLTANVNFNFKGNGTFKEGFDGYKK
jgi:putative FmdB family regulatory protein